MVPQSKAGKAAGLPRHTVYMGPTSTSLDVKVWWFSRWPFGLPSWPKRTPLYFVLSLFAVGARRMTANSSVVVAHKALQFGCFAQGRLAISGMQTAVFGKFSRDQSVFSSLQRTACSGFHSGRMMVSVSLAFASGWKVSLFLRCFKIERFRLVSHHCNLQFPLNCLYCHYLWILRRGLRFSLRCLHCSRYLFLLLSSLVEFSYLFSNWHEFPSTLCDFLLQLLQYFLFLWWEQIHKISSHLLLVDLLQ